jgi:[acyl-carrier-protein] S-malonyltransferase
MLVRKRATFMHESIPEGTGGMAAVMGLEAEEVESICKESADGQVLVLANYNAPTQIVLSGEEEPLARAIALARERRARAVRLPVSAPFHSPLMGKASEMLAEALEDVEFKDPKIPWVSNVTASAVDTAGECRRLLSSQVCSPVRWEASIRWMQHEGVTRFIELGPRKVLKGLCRMIDPTIRCDTAETLDELRALEGSMDQPGGE